MLLCRDQYICVLDMKEDLGLTQEELDALIPSGYDSLYDAAINMYKDGFSGFSTGMVTRIQNGYQIEATGTEVGQMLVSLLDYMAQNPEPVINALEEYLKVTMQASGATEAEIADLTSSMQAARDDVEAFRTETMKNWWISILKWLDFTKEPRICTMIGKPINFRPSTPKVHIISTQRFQ